LRLAPSLEPSSPAAMVVSGDITKKVIVVTIEVIRLVIFIEWQWLMQYSAAFSHVLRAGNFPEGSARLLLPDPQKVLP
jgi:hypothetical protein